MSLDTEIIESIRARSALTGEPISRIVERGICLLLDVEVPAARALEPRKATLRGIAAEVLDAIRHLGPGPHSTSEISAAAGSRGRPVQRALATLVRRGDIYPWGESSWATETPINFVGKLIQRWRDAGGCPAVEFEGEILIPPNWSGDALISQVRSLFSHLEDPAPVAELLSAAVGVPASYSFPSPSPSPEPEPEPEPEPSPSPEPVP